MEVDQFLNNTCLKITSVAIAAGYCFLAVSFLTLSAGASESDVLKLLGHQVSGYNSKYEHKYATIVNNHFEK